MSTLFEITQNYKELENYANSITDETSEEELDKLSEIYEKANFMHADKVESYCMVIDNIQADIDSISKVLKDLKHRQDVKKKQVERLKDYMHTSLTELCKEKINTPLYTVTVAKKPRKVSYNEEKVPDNFKSETKIIKVDKNALKKYLKQNEQESCDFCWLEPQETTVRIKRS